MVNVLDLIFPERKKRNLLFKTAIDSANGIQNLFKLYKEGDFKINLENQTFTRIYDHDPKSPAIYWIDENQLIIRYPPYSTPYYHSFKDKCKFVECLSGVIYDKNSNFKLLQGDKVKIEPNHNFEPYTESEACYLRVCIGPCDSLIDRICA